MGNNLVFLISQPRSGSTLLQAMLGSHPDVHTCSEPWIALPFIYALRSEGAEFEFNGSWSKDAINAFFKENAIDEEFYNSALSSFLITLYQKALDTSGKKVFLDKTPRYYEIGADLINIFPEAKFIVLYRHPLSVLNSILNTWVKDQTDILYYYARDLLSAPQKLTDFVSRHAENICLVRYEELVRSPVSETRRICAYLGIEYWEEIINYESDKQWSFGDQKFRNKKAPDDKSTEAWKDHLNDQQTLNFYYYYLRELGQEIINSMGYDFTSDFDLIKRSNPNEDDFKTWEKLLHGRYIIPVEEQRQLVKNKLQDSFFKTLLGRFTS